MVKSDGIEIHLVGGVAGYTCSELYETWDALIRAPKGKVYWGVEARHRESGDTEYWYDTDSVVPVSVLADYGLLTAREWREEQIRRYYTADRWTYYGPAFVA